MNINAMMSQAKKMQGEMDKAQKELAKKEFVVKKQGIEVIITGDRKIKKVDINEVLIDPDDKELLEDMIVICMNEATDLINEEEEKIQPSSKPGMPF